MSIRWAGLRSLTARILKTDRSDLSADGIWRIYLTLTRADAAFRAMKSPLPERPIFQQAERRVETHIFLCVLAYHLLVAIENTLLGIATVRKGGVDRRTCDSILIGSCSKRKHSVVL